TRPHGDRTPDRVAVVSRKRGRVANERCSCLPALVLTVPAALQLAMEKAGLPLAEHLALAMRLSADRVMPHDEPDGKRRAARKPRFVSAGRDQIEIGRLLPAANLQSIVQSRLRVVLQRVAHILAWTKVVAGRPEIEAFEVNRIETQRIDVL